MGSASPYKEKAKLMTSDSVVDLLVLVEQGPVEGYELPDLSVAFPVSVGVLEPVDSSLTFESESSQSVVKIFLKFF